MAEERKRIQERSGDIGLVSADSEQRTESSGHFRKGGKLKRWTPEIERLKKKKREIELGWQELFSEKDVRGERGIVDAASITKSQLYTLSRNQRKEGIVGGEGEDPKGDLEAQVISGGSSKRDFPQSSTPLVVSP